MKPPSQLLLYFSVNNVLLGFPLSCVREIILLPELVEPPGCPPVIKGFMNVAGQAVPVASASRLLGLPDKEYSPYAHVLWLQSGYALLVDRVLGLLKTDNLSEISKEENISFNEMVERCFTVREQAVHVLNEQRLLLAKERTKLKEFAQIESTRLEEMEAAF